MLAKFLIAVRCDDVKFVSEALLQGISTQSTDENGNSALIYAVSGNALQVMQLLLASGADPQQQNKFRDSPLSIALCESRQEAIETLLRHGADVFHAFRHLVHNEAAESLFTPILPFLPSALVDAFRQGRLALALMNSGDCLAFMSEDAACIGGIYRKQPDELMMCSLARIPSRVSRIKVGADPESLDFLLQNTAHLTKQALVVELSASNSGMRYFCTTENPDADLPPPAIVEVEPIDWCNLRCIMCHVSQMPEDHKPTRVAPEDLVGMGLNDAQMVQLGAAFEPMLHKGFASFVKACGDTPISITTNATLLTPQIIEVLASHENVRINISIDGGSAEVYERIRRQGKFDDLRLRLQDLLAARDPRRMSVGFSCTLMKSNLGKLTEIVDLAEALGVDSVSFRTVFIRDQEILGESLEDCPEIVIRELDRVALYVIQRKLRVMLSSAHFAYSNLRNIYPGNFVGDMAISDLPPVLPIRYYPLLQLGRTQRAVNCVSPERFVRIDANGVVSLCKGFVIGNVKNAPLRAIWNGDAAKFVRRIVSSTATVCNNCDHFRFCLNSAGRSSIQASALSGPLKYSSSVSGAERGVSLNHRRTVLYDQLSDHRTADIARSIQLDRPDMTLVTLATGIDPHVPNIEGRRPVSLAAEQGALNVLRILLDYGVPVNEADSIGLPLAAAARMRHEMIVAPLTQYGANVAAAIDELNQAGDISAATWLHECVSALKCTSSMIP